MEGEEEEREEDDVEEEREGLVEDREEGRRGQWRCGAQPRGALLGRGGREEV